MSKEYTVTDPRNTKVNKTRPLPLGTLQSSEVELMSEHNV